MEDACYMLRMPILQDVQASTCHTVCWMSQPLIARPAPMAMLGFAAYQHAQADTYYLNCLSCLAHPDRGLHHECGLSVPFSAPCSNPHARTLLVFLVPLLSAATLNLWLPLLAHTVFSLWLI